MKSSECDWINKEDLFCDSYKALLGYEFPEELALIKRLIELAEEYVQSKETVNTWSYEGVCYLFAKTIVQYSKMAYDNLLLGHYNAVYMISRVIVENNVLFNIIYYDETKELWKYYLAQSFKITLNRFSRKDSQEMKESMERIYKDYNIDREFYETTDGKKPYIDRNYGWSYKVNKKFDFAGMCELLDEGDYDDFKLMSEYSHGTAFHLKIFLSMFVENMYTMLSVLYIGLFRMIMMYCDDERTEEFDEVTEDIENSIWHFLDRELKE